MVKTEAGLAKICWILLSQKLCLSLEPQSLQHVTQVFIYTSTISPSPAISGDITKKASVIFCQQIQNFRRFY